jgi:hypothetical protein
VLGAQHCFAFPTVEGSDVNILRVVTRVRRDQRCFAGRMVKGGDVNILRVVARVQMEQLCFAGRTVKHPSPGVAQKFCWMLHVGSLQLKELVISHVRPWICQVHV